MATNPTREKLLAVAERHFAEHGYDAASVRRIMAEAGVDTGAVHYHFGSKQSLFEAVLKRRLAPVNAARMDALETLERRASPPTLAELTEAFLKPSFELARDRQLGQTWVRLVARFRVEQGPQWDAVRSWYGEVPERFLAAFARALPQLGRDELALRFTLLIGTAANFLTDARTHEAFALGDTTTDARYAQFMAFALAGMSAPPANDNP
jgi:AcrR family transcriptional regulator